MSDLVFLDANILVRAAWSRTNKCRRLWRLPDVELCASAYAIEEARRNTPPVQRREWLEELLSRVRVVAEREQDVSLPPDVYLPEKDIPILAAAIQARATHLITADRRHFGDLYGRHVSGVMVLSPSTYLLDRP